MLTMYKSVFGKTEKKINALIHGAVMVDTNEEQKSMELLDSIWAAGCTTFDTAHDYREGRCELLLGKWMEERKNRDKIFIISKCGHYNQYRRRVTPYDIGADLLDSLVKLRTDYIDMYMLHRDDPDYPVEELVDAFNYHIEKGSINCWGVSNWSYERVKAANDYAKKNHLIPPAAASSHFSLGVQYEKPWGGCPFGDEGVSETITGDDKVDARRYFTEKNMAFFAYSPLCRGLFSGSVTREKFRENPNIVDEPTAKAYCHEGNFKRLERVEIFAKERGYSVPQVALAWLLSQPLNVFLLVGANSAEEYLHDTGAFEIKLTKKEMDWMNLLCDER